jgi:hypothetical protein
MQGYSHTNFLLFVLDQMPDTGVAYALPPGVQMSVAVYFYYVAMHAFSS